MTKHVRVKQHAPEGNPDAFCVQTKDTEGLDGRGEPYPVWLTQQYFNEKDVAIEYAKYVAEGRADEFNVIFEQEIKNG